jgi:hypothetical protein
MSERPVEGRRRRNADAPRKAECDLRAEGHPMRDCAA